MKKDLSIKFCFLETRQLHSPINKKNILLHPGFVVGL